uniref:Uncharacterized protein n=1 Tax=Phlegmariurus squarrosus TaxID=73615 RepID=H9M873_PHLSQ|nr:hypothetical protein HusqMp98 [Phlegmariurus squarrosus]AEV55780.1 hypothetical protein HusqMp98 [Phlegmariurus squarrosus]
MLDSCFVAPRYDNASTPVLETVLVLIYPESDDPSAWYLAWSTFHTHGLFPGFLGSVHKKIGWLLFGKAGKTPTQRTPKKNAKRTRVGFALLWPRRLLYYYYFMYFFS